MALHDSHVPTEDLRVRAAYWDAVTLLDAGWMLRFLRYIPTTGAGIVIAHTPTHRGVSISSTDRRQPFVQEYASVVQRLAESVAELGAGPGDRLSDLTWLLQGLNAGRSRCTPAVRRDQIPDPRLQVQPPNLRAAYWMLGVLICDYHWQITDIGDPIAGGGFIADIPDDLTAIYPGGIPADGTAATTLARLIPLLDQGSLHYLRQVNGSDLAHSRSQLTNS